MTFSKVSLCVLLGTLFCLGAAQRCLSELQAGADTAYLSQPASGLDAASYLKHAVDLLEPALPPLPKTGAEDPLEAEPLSGTAEFLAERKLLPASWEPNELSAATWQFMLDSFAAWYGVAAPAVSAEPLTRGELVAELAELIGRVAPTLEPVALVAAADDDPERIAFWSVIRNHGVYPRMVVVRPPGEGISLADGVREALPALANCAVPLKNYVFTLASTAQRLFLANSKAQMVIVQRYPATGEGLEYVASGKEASYFTFADPSLEGVISYAALFVGPGVPLMTILRIIPQLRTNMSPREILDFVSAK
ncbi:MAG TPA: hypothetical protein VF171_01885 [Trueperaceae bacterium]